MDFDKVVDHLQKIMNKYIDDPTIEIEARIGIFDEDDNKKFSPNIGDDQFEKIKKLLDSGKDEEWIKPKNCINQTDYFNNKYRLSVYEDGKQRCMEKKRLENVNIVLKDGPYDIRISFSKETPVDVDSFPTKDKCGESRTKKRFTYKYKMWDFDLTEITHNISGEEGISYEYEIELDNIRNKIKDTTYLSKSIMLKILDIKKVYDEKDDEKYTYEVI